MSELKFKHFTKVKDGVIPEQVRRDIGRDIKEFEGCWIDIEIRKRRSKRSIEQNAYYFGVIVTSFQQGAFEEWGETLTKEEAHESLKKACNFKEFITKEGEVVTIIKETKGFDTLKAEEYYERCRRLIFTYFNIVVPLPGEQMDAFK